MTAVAAARRTAPPVLPKAKTRLDGECLRIPASARTLSGFREWAKSDELPEKLRVAFIDGEIYLDMSWEEIETHNSVKTEIIRVLSNLNVEFDQGKLCSDGVLVSNEEANVSNNPDGLFFLWESLDRGQVRLVPRKKKQGQYVEIEGTPDWLMEILSDSSVKKDTDKLRKKYHQVGVKEYWLIDARGEELSFQILHWRKTGYVVAPSHEGWQRSRVFRRSFRLERTRDKRGLCRYRLQVQEE